MTVPVDENRALMRYVRPVTNSVSPYDLQRWAVAVLQDRKDELSSTNDQAPFLTDIPAFIRTIPTLGFAPARAFLCRAGRESGQQPYVGIVYLGGFGTWGIRVGSEMFRLEEDRHCYQWIPGVYITISP
jgi:hypothetical protein